MKGWGWEVRPVIRETPHMVVTREISGAGSQGQRGRPSLLYSRLLLLTTVAGAASRGTSWGLVKNEHFWLFPDLLN